MCTPSSSKSWWQLYSAISENARFCLAASKTWQAETPLKFTWEGTANWGDPWQLKNIHHGYPSYHQPARWSQDEWVGLSCPMNLKCDGQTKRSSLMKSNWKLTSRPLSCLKPHTQAAIDMGDVKNNGMKTTSQRWFPDCLLYWILSIWLQARTSKIRSRELSERQITMAFIST